MSAKYKTTKFDKAYFVIITIVGWIDIFTRVNKKTIINFLKCCQINKGLEIYAYCLMPSHLRLICSVQNEMVLADIMRSFKEFTSTKIINLILKGLKSRWEWLTPLFSKAYKHLKRDQIYNVWQDSYNAEVIDIPKFLYQRLNYIHHYPVIDEIGFNAKDYRFSSARIYVDLEYELEVIVLPNQLINVN